MKIGICFLKNSIILFPRTFYRRNNDRRIAGNRFNKTFCCGSSISTRYNTTIHIVYVVSLSYRVKTCIKKIKNKCLTFRDVWPIIHDGILGLVGRLSRSSDLVQNGIVI